MRHFLRKWSPYFRIKKFRDNLNKIWTWILRHNSNFDNLNINKHVNYIFDRGSQFKNEKSQLSKVTTRKLFVSVSTKVRWIFHFREQLNKNESSRVETRNNGHFDSKITNFGFEIRFLYENWFDFATYRLFLDQKLGIEMEPLALANIRGKYHFCLKMSRLLPIFSNFSSKMTRFIAKKSDFGRGLLSTLNNRC